MNQVILVNAQDQVIGAADKLQAHQRGWLHRAFSVFVVRDNHQQREILLQQRDVTKYHAGGLWTNTCCSHPQPGETILNAAERRLQEELGFTAKLQEIGVFTYRAEFTNGLIEHEIDHVLVGNFSHDLTITPNIAEVMAIRWVNLAEANHAYQQNPDLYTPWFAQALQIVKQYYS